MIRLPDPTRLGRALGEVRELLGIGRRECARQIGKATGRTETSVNAQLWTWDVGNRKPDLVSLGPYLAALDFDLALTPRTQLADDDPLAVAIRCARQEVVGGHPWIPGACFRMDPRLQKLLLMVFDSLVPHDELPRAP